MADSAAFDERAARELERALRGAATPADPAIARLVEVAERFRDGIAPEIPDFRAQRAAFVQGVGNGRKSWGWMRLFGPATVTAIALLIAIMIGRSALPGEAFYPVRQALRAVGLAPFSVSEIDEEIARAKQLLAQAEGLKNHDSEQARELAFEAVKVLGFAEQLLPEVSDRGNSREALVRALLKRAQGILVLEPKERGRGNDRAPGVDNDPGASKGPKGDPPRGNSGAVRNDRNRDDRGHRGTRREDRDDRGQGSSKRNDGSSSGPDKGSGSGDDQNDDDTDDDFAGKSEDRRRDGEHRNVNSDPDEDPTPSPQQTTDELRRDAEDRVRHGHGNLKNPSGGNDDRDDDDGADD